MKKVADKKEKTPKAQKPKNKSKGDKKRLDISTRAIADNIIFSKDEQWAYYRLSNSVYDFLSNDARISMAAQLVNAFTNLLSDNQEPLDCHLIITSSPVDVDAWETQIDKLTEDWNRSPGFNNFINSQAQYLRAEEFMKKVVYLGINMGKRNALDISAGTFVEAGVKGATEVFKEWLGKALQTPSEDISPSEEREARKKEEDYYRTVSTGNLKAERCSAEELLLLMKRQFYPAMSAPYLDVDHENRMGPGDLELELTSAIKNNLRYLTINQVMHGAEYDGYRATMTISKLPHQVNFPYNSFPFMYFMSKMGLPFTSWARFTLYPTAKMKQKLEKKKKEQADELENLAAGDTFDTSVGVLPTDVVEALQDMKLLNDRLSQGNTPWVEGTYRIAVETPDETTLKKFVEMVKQSYSDIGVHMNWTVGDQAELFLEQMPGDKLRGKEHSQMTDLVYLSTSGFLYSGDVGDLVYGSDAGEGGLV